MPASAFVGSRVGVSAGSFINRLSDSGLRSDISLIEDLNVGWIRLDINWQNVERQPGVYDWREPDALIDAATGAGLNVLGTLVYAPDWAVDDTVPVDESRYDVEAYGRFAAAAADRYQPLGVSHWEIWNEPNLQTFWGSAPNAEAYGQLLEAAYAAIKSANPSAQVISGGLAPALTTPALEIAPVTFVERLYAGGFGDDFDHLGMHPYSYPALPSLTAPWNAYFQMGDMHAIMRANGQSFKDIWLTEVGAPTGSNPRAVTLDRQRDIVEEAIECAIVTPWIGPIFLYQHRDEPGGQDSVLEDNFGLALSNGSPKPAYTAVQQLNGQLLSAPRCVIAF